jgi:hypothetical protein
MSKRESNTPATGASELTSAGVPWSEVPDTPCPYTEWLDGRQGPAEDILPSVVLSDSLRVRSRNDIQ